MAKKYPVRLTAEQRQTLRGLFSRGTASARTLTHAHILLKVDEAEGGPAWAHAKIREAFEVSEPLICRVKQRFVEGGLDAALHRKEQTHRKARKLDGSQEAQLIALACQAAPAGRERWSLRLLAEQMIELGIVEAISHETVRQALKRGRSSPG